jgi:hypothetical protein
MMSKINCWEFKKCGRQPGGNKVHELGVCPAATFKEANGFCGGINGGRACPYITGTFCMGTIQGTHREKEKYCAECDFYKMVAREEGGNFSVAMFSNYIRARKGNK